MLCVEVHHDAGCMLATRRVSTYLKAAAAGTLSLPALHKNKTRTNLVTKRAETAPANPWGPAARGCSHCAMPACRHQCSSAVPAAVPVAVAVAVPVPVPVPVAVGIGSPIVLTHAGNQTDADFIIIEYDISFHSDVRNVHVDVQNAIDRIDMCNRYYR